LPVQWPDEDALSEIRSFKTLTMTGEEIVAAGAYQNLVLTVDPMVADLLHLDGAGGVNAEVEFEDTEMGQTSNCSVDADMGYLVNDIVMDISEGGSEGPGCPRSGTLSYAGSIDISCTGDRELSVSGSWSVSQTFDNTNVAYSVSNGSNGWTLNETCD
jgi:hypothetical protein